MFTHVPATAPPLRVPQQGFAPRVSGIGLFARTWLEYERRNCAISAGPGSCLVGVVNLSNEADQTRPLWLPQADRALWSSCYISPRRALGERDTEQRATGSGDDLPNHWSASKRGNLKLVFHAFCMMLRSLVFFGGDCALAW